MQKKEQGFTLIELMVTIAVLAIIAMMAVPSFGDLVAKKKLDITARDFALVFGEARGQAISLRKNIIIKLTCPLNSDGIIECPPNTSTTYSWISKNNDIELASDAIDVMFSGLGIAEQRTKLIDNPSFDPDYEHTKPDGTKIVGDTLLLPEPDKSLNPSKIPEIVPLEFTLCNAEIKTSKTILVSKIGTVDSITTGVCS